MPKLPISTFSICGLSAGDGLVLRDLLPQRLGLGLRTAGGKLQAGSRRPRRDGAGGGGESASAAAVEQARPAAACFRRRSAVAAACCVSVLVDQLELAAAAEGGGAAGFGGGAACCTGAASGAGAGAGADEEPVNEPNQRVRRLPLLAAGSIAVRRRPRCSTPSGEALAVRVGGGSAASFRADRHGSLAGRSSACADAPRW